jgi:hypothetical protein
MRYSVAIHGGSSHIPGLSEVSEMRYRGFKGAVPEKGWFHGRPRARHASGFRMAETASITAALVNKTHRVGPQPSVAVYFTFN